MSTIDIASPAEFQVAVPPQSAIPGLVWAFRIHADGSPEPLPIEQPIELTHDGRLWLHLNLADARALQWLASALDLPISLPAWTLLSSKDTYQQLHTADDGVHGVISDLMRHRRGDRGNRVSALRDDRGAVDQRPSTTRCAPWTPPAARSRAAGVSTALPPCSKPSSKTSPTPWTGSPTASPARSTRSRNR